MTGFLFPLVAIITGLLAASSTVIRRLPETEGIIEKLKPYEAIIGSTSLFFAISGLFNLSLLSRIGGIVFIGNIACIVACFTMGFLLGYPVLQGLFIDDLSETNRSKAKEFYYRLTPYKTVAGAIGIGSGVLLLLL